VAHPCRSLIATRVGEHESSLFVYSRRKGFPPFAKYAKDGAPKLVGSQRARAEARAAPSLY
jgi:hypothetical protein